MAERVAFVPCIAGLLRVLLEMLELELPCSFKISRPECDLRAKLRHHLYVGKLLRFCKIAQKHFHECEELRIPRPLKSGYAWPLQRETEHLPSLPRITHQHVISTD